MMHRLRRKFICVNMAVVLILLILMLMLVMTSTHSRMEHDSIRMMEQIAADPAFLFRPTEQKDELNLPFIALILDAEGGILSCYGGYYDLSDHIFLEEVVSKARESGQNTGILEQYHLRYLLAEHDTGWILVLTDMTSERHAASHLLNSCLLIGFVTLCLFFLVSVLLARWAVHPVEKAWEQQRQFIGDASHELKTPLTVILTDTELLLSERCTEEERNNFLHSVRTMGEQMRGLVEEMLALSRAENAVAEADRKLLDWSRCVNDAILPFEALFFEKGLPVEASIEARLHIIGNEAQLKQLTEIFLDNAQKYGEPGSTVRIELKRCGRSARLQVESSGAEIANEDLEKIFQRFYRVNRARSMDRSYGLGLAIAKQIAENHKGKIWAESENGKNRFLVQLPAADVKSGRQEV